ncbi:DUF5722 domain-containing protein [Actinoallomurus sp. NBC_01490]|uniref:DUF5722 domain-containing protein n=1 Tax=Actinoallomurus sp. NBC_01490 TaxID=2903557 RepID=UPI002E333834|nr:DUF5722 domain-containing protein [Actinoallomurus sp. NBC_01490]
MLQARWARHGILTVLLALATVLSTATTMTLSAGSARAQSMSGITQVAVDETGVVVTGDAGTTAGKVAIYALGPWQEPKIPEGESPVATSEPDATGAFTARLPRFADDGRDRLYDKFLAVAGGDTVLGSAHYADKIDLAVNRTAYPQTPSIKGLQVEMTDDAEELGVKHAAINLPLDQMMLSGPGAPDNTIEFTSQGRTFYFNKSAVEGVDAQVKPLSDDGTLVNLIVLAYAEPGNSSSAWRQLIHPDAEIGTGTVYAFDTKTADGAAYYTAAMEFFTQRYTRADEEYGRAWGWIIGNEVDAQQYWYNMGRQDRGTFLDHYSRALRIAWQALRKSDANGRVYISLTHYWNSSANDDPAYTYKGRDIVDGLNAITKQQGDFSWNIAYHPYPEDLFNPAFWDDKDALDTSDSPLITFKNIQVLPRYLAQDGLKFGGEQRRVILSEQGLNAKDYTTENLRLQAAAFAYAYYKIAFTGGIDAFILHRHVDHEGEGGLRLGLWTWDPDHPFSAAPGEHKPIYDVFKYIDTPQSLRATEFAKTIIGISDWKAVIPNFDPAKLARRSLPYPADTRLSAAPVGENRIADFEQDTQGWQVADNASGVEQVTTQGASGTGALRVSFGSGLAPWSTYAKTGKGTGVVFDRPVDATRMPWLSASIRVPESADDGFKPGNEFSATIRVYSTDGRVAEGTGTLDPAGGWNRLSLDLSHWPGRTAIHRIKVWVRGSVGSDWKGYFDVDRVSMAPRVITHA